ncbi:hypothetical protein PFICI_13448 [Pestalotiopsis fici W106-1]|uniref:Methyltransferase n=1 Tax=Pestalotiopsis fici (strain W106-1 / CGMCC3.15140) TaxID=1229662 RepID=W3WMH4_PESFW|nr:uncharacterized protein PFICI_13448 [Pestalotiopsis fici W106-1]ETS74964.1 hypothetical protein PFICI_13448 [Pestalotiopsis fici W106-1]
MASINHVVSSQEDEVITSEVSYLKIDPKHRYEKPYRVNYNTGGLFPWTNTSHDTQPIFIKNFRTIQTPGSLEKFGFSVKTLQSQLSRRDFEDSVKVEEWFYPEVKKLLNNTFPEAAKIEILEHGIRRRDHKARNATGGLAPANIVHIDYTENSAFDFSHRIFKASAEQYPRLLMVNLWKSIQGPGNDWPLAFCDRRTVDYDMDIVGEDLVFKSGFTEHARLYHNPRHEWYYFQDLQDDEVILFHQFDSELEGGGGTPHASFFNPLTSKAAAPRISIELRALIYFE